jgi:membrane protease YdiL (CAAX protease family)
LHNIQAQGWQFTLLGLAFILKLDIHGKALFNKRLQNYETNIIWWIFVAADTGVLVITFLKVRFQSIRAALMNPVRSLGAE